MQLTNQTYGSDSTGLICGYLFYKDEAGKPITSDEAVQWLEKSDQEHGFVWLHFNLANQASEKWLKDHIELPTEWYEALHEGSRSSRIEHTGQNLIAVMNDVLHDFAFEPSDISTLWLTAHPKYVVSARRKPLKTVDMLRQAVNNSELFASPIELLTHLLRDQADVLIRIVRKIIQHVDDIEDQLLAERLNYRRRTLGETRRVLVRMQRLLAPEPAALFRLLQKSPAWLTENDVQELRQSTEEFALVLNDMAGLQERIKLLQEEIAANMNEKISRSLFMLTIVTVLALPINMIAGLMGMNVGGIPLADDAHGFEIIVFVVASFTVIAGWWAFRKYDDKS